VKSAREEGTTFSRGSHLYEVKQFGKRAERLQKAEVRFDNIHGKRETGYYSRLEDDIDKPLR